MTKTLPLSLVLVAAVCLTGCTTVREQRRRQTVREQSELDALRLDVSRLRERVEGFDAAQQGLYSQIDELRDRMTGADEGLRERLAGVEQRVKTLDAAREQDRQAIVDSLSKQISGMMKAQASRPAPAMQGYEHVVQSGETLSAIASAYGATQSAIIKANNLKNPDRVRIGQKLFIPE